ncbi:DUF6786 family protein [Runella sp.]|jgi:hypothetical protein|uniref:DUF6786 family protein n=2 Tax=Runella sp. TaxID=1960881 RepID=UPI003018729C
MFPTPKSSFLNLSIVTLIMGMVCMSCSSSKNETMSSASNSFGADLEFLKKYQKPLVLTAPDDDSAQVAVIGTLQGRVMTSTANGTSGNSYGWLNYKLLESGKFTPHMSAFGGEDRFWIGPEGGQFSIYFQQGKQFVFDDWQVPAVIDSEPFEVVSSDKSKAAFRKTASLTNYSGTKFDIVIDRSVEALSKVEVETAINFPLKDVKTVAYETVSKITNQGPDWKKETGLLSIWILGMFNPTPQTTIVIPFKGGADHKSKINDSYFGKVPAERLIIEDSVLYFKADGKHRSKIGLPPSIAKPAMGSYDSEKGVLTIVTYDLDPTGDYVNSMWEIQKEPFKGDAANSYNDGPVEDGTQMGPFYELESSSPAKALKKGETLTHRSRTYHFEGDKTALNAVARRMLGVSLEEIAKH